MQQSQSHGSPLGTPEHRVAAGKKWQLGTSSISNRPQMSHLHPLQLFLCLFSCTVSISVPNEGKAGRTGIQLWSCCFHQLLLPALSHHPRCGQLICKDITVVEMYCESGQFSNLDLIFFILDLFERHFWGYTYAWVLNHAQVFVLTTPLV